MRGVDMGVHCVSHACEVPVGGQGHMYCVQGRTVAIVGVVLRAWGR